MEGLAPKVDTARDRIVDDLLPKVAEAIAAVAAASAAARANAADVADRSGGAYAVLKGEAVAKPRRKGKMLLTLGILAAAAAAAAVVFKKSAPREDPWATPLEDPYTAPGAGRESTTTAARDKVASLSETAKEKASSVAGAAKEKAADAKDKTSEARRERQGQGDGQVGQGVERPGRQG